MENEKCKSSWFSWKTKKKEGQLAQNKNWWQKHVQYDCLQDQFKTKPEVSKLWMHGISLLVPLELNLNVVFTFLLSCRSFEPSALPSTGTYHFFQPVKSRVAGTLKISPKRAAASRMIRPTNNNYVFKVTCVTFISLRMLFLKFTGASWLGLNS